MSLKKKDSKSKIPDDKSFKKEEEIDEEDIDEEEESEEEELDEESDEDSDEDSDDDADDSDDDDSSSQDEEEEYDEDLERELKGIPDRTKARKAFEDRKGKKADDEGDDEEDEDDKPITRRDLKGVRAEIRKEVLEEQAREIAGEMASSPKQAELIYQIYSNRVFPAHLSLREQMEEAFAIANRRKIIAVSKEVRRALKGKASTYNNGASSHRAPMDSPAPKVSKSDQNSYARAGFKFDAKKNLYVKVLPNKKRLYKDPKSKRTWLE